MKHAAIVVAGFLFLLQPALLACPVCFQVDPSPATDGVQAAVLVLMAVTTTVLGGFAAFIVRFLRRSHGLARG